ncbi:MAG: hypothetical protein ACI9XO_003456, partial [Paraglaciecola sp.]
LSGLSKFKKIFLNHKNHRIKGIAYYFSIS